MSESTAIGHESLPIHLDWPFAPEAVRELRCGDRVLLTGRIYAARDAAHKRMIDTLDRGEPLPVDLRGQIIYYVGPTPARPGAVIGSAGPTTAGRMDAYTPRLMEQGLLGMLGKGNRSPAVREALCKHGGVYLAATGGAGALLAQRITGYKILAYPELGPEALAELTVVDFPAIVVADCTGNDFYSTGRAPYQRVFLPLSE